MNIHRSSQIFRDALDVADAERSTFIDLACAGDSELRAGVEQLLALAFADGPELARPELTDVTAAANLRGTAQNVGQLVGAFSLVRPIGTGGMGAVWLAQRVEDFSQQVAIKWLHAGLSRTARTRFARERETLAKLEHPGIARILDGGSDFCAEWYAMEFVDGLPLDQYAKANNLDLPARLKLVLQLCDAVQYAHQNLIVHRDLKPANVLVGKDGAPKLLDFGIAKSLHDNGDLTASVAPMTFAYAAPEQIKNERITTATDVYALGVILYELLTGQRPHKVKVGDGDGSLSILQAITDTDATAPSSMLARETVMTNGIKASALKGDLDTIVLKALNRNPARRYASAQAFADDLRRFLADEPISARPDSRWYRLRKLIRRNRALAAVSALALLAVLGFAWQAHMDATRAELAQLKAEQETERAQAVQEFLTDLFAYQRPDLAQGREMTAKDLLDEAEKRLMSPEQIQSGEVRAALLDTLARLRYDLNDFEAALRHNDASIELARQRFGPQSTPFGLALIEHADTLWWLGRMDETMHECDRGLQILRDAKDVRTESLENAHQVALINCADNFRSADQFSRTAALQHEAETRLQQMPAPDQNVENYLLRSRAKLANAQSDFRTALSVKTQLLNRLAADPSTPPSDIATLLHGRGVANYALGNSAAAVTDLRAAMESHLRTFGPTGVHVAGSRRMLALALADIGDIAQARTQMETALSAAQEHFEPAGADYIQTLRFAGNFFIQDGQSERGEALLHAALAADEHSFGAGHSVALQIRLLLLESALEKGAIESAKQQSSDLARITSAGENARRMRSDDALMQDRLALQLARLLLDRDGMRRASDKLSASLERLVNVSNFEFAIALSELALSARAQSNAVQFDAARQRLRALLANMRYDTERRKHVSALVSALATTKPQAPTQMQDVTPKPSPRQSLLLTRHAGSLAAIPEKFWRVVGIWNCNADDARF